MDFLCTTEITAVMSILNLKENFFDTLRAFLHSKETSIMAVEWRDEVHHAHIAASFLFPKFLLQFFVFANYHYTLIRKRGRSSISVLPVYQKRKDYIR